MHVPFAVVVLGVIVGLTYGVLAIGLVLIYRSSRIINFAHAEVGAFAASVFGVWKVGHHLPYWLLFPLALALGAATSAAVEVVAVRRLRNAPAVMSVVATLGAAAFLFSLEAAVNTSIHNGAAFPQPPGIPTMHIGALVVTRAYTAQLIITPLIVLALVVFLRRSRYGIAIRAAADNRDNASLRGIAPGRMSLIAWGIAGAISAYAAIMQFPNRGFAVTGVSLGPDLLVRALLVAVLARMDNLWTALVCGVGLGIVEQVLLWNYPSGGQVEALLFVGMLVALLLQTRQGSREREQGSWLAVSPARPLPPELAKLWVARNLGKIGAAAMFGFLALFLLATNSAAFTMTGLIAYTLVGLSVFVITGLTGQLSLGQFALAGIGAVLSYRITESGTNFALAVALAASYTAIVSVGIGLPALRIRGLMLTVSTLAFAVMAESWLFAQPWAFGQGATPAIPSLPVLGRLSTGRHYYLIALPTLAFGLWLAWNVSRGGLRRMLVALRDNEDAARAFSVKATRLKLEAFAIAGFLAGLGGALFAHSLPLLSSNTFPATESITVVAIAAIGGVSLLAGSFLGALYLIAFPAFVRLDAAGLAASSLGWLVLILYFPGGLAQMLAPVRGWLLKAIARMYGITLVAHEPPPDTGAPEQVQIRAPQLEAPTGARMRSVGLPLLSVRDLTKTFGGVRAVDGVSFDVARGEILGLIGPNGAGKTTLFEMIGGFTRPDHGTVLFAGADVTRLAPERRAELGLVRSFQEARLFGTMTVLDTIQLAFESRDPTPPVASLLGLPASQRRERRCNAAAREIIASMGLETYRDTPIAALSTGTRRITELACLVAMRPALLLLDEPSSGIAQRETEALGNVIRGIQGWLDATIVLIEHDMPLVTRLSDRILALEAGTQIALGDPASVCADPLVIESYLGSNELAIARSGAASGRCAAMTRAGERCSRPATHGSRCGQHAAHAALSRRDVG